MKKQNSALIASLIVTGILFAIMTATSVNALINKNGTATSVITNGSQTSEQARIAELEARVAEYQTREIEYQQLLDEDQQKIDQFQQFILALQRAGIIRVNPDGSVVVNTRGGSDGDND